mgnify:FL=1|jgi:hypothetical protein|tara:strand:- start:1846 stop:2076 length:231 start_codon:yes stop_codon:yes gene_type:complete
MLEIIGWVYLGVIIGFIAGYITSGILDRANLEMVEYSTDIEQEIQHLIITRDALKEEITRLGNKPKPRSKRKRNVK